MAVKLNPSNTSIVKRLLSGRNSRPLLSILNKIEPADLASLISQFHSRERRLLVKALMQIDKAHSSLLEVPEKQLGPILEGVEESDLVSLCLKAPDETVAYFLRLVNDKLQEKVLEELDSTHRSHIQQLLSYPEESAGRMMQSSFFKLPIHITAQEGLDLLREKAQEQSIYYIYCVDKDQRLHGVISLRALATAAPETPLEKLTKKEVVSVRPTNTDEEVAQIVAHYDFIAVPVVDENNRLLGIITIDDVVDIIQEQATANIYAQAGLQEDDRVFSSPLFKIKTRLPWMFLNLLLASLASSVVSLFENTMHELIILAVLKNIVAGMGGNTAIQTLTVVTRGIATGDFNFISYGKAVTKETLVGVTIGCITGISAGILVYFWKDDAMVSGVICLSMILNSLVASTFGAIVPLILSHFKYDPATGSGVIVTMITDIFSFFSFLGIATLGLKMIQ